MTTSVSKLLGEIKKAVGHKKCYLYGSAIRDILMGEIPTVYSIFIKVHHAENRDKILQKLPQSSKVFYTLGTSLNLSDVFTINLMYVDLEDLLNGQVDIKSFQYGQRDFNKNSIRFTKEALADMKPDYILRAIRLSVDTGFHFDPKTITHICNHITILAKSDRRIIYRFLCESLTSKRTRRIIALFNTLGLSKELFGFHLYETSVVNHLKPSDVLEFFAIILNPVPVDDIATILVERFGFHLRDTLYIVNLAKAIDHIESEDETAARTFLKDIEKTRVPNAARLLKFLNFKELSKNIRKQKGSSVSLEDLCVDASMIKIAFGIENEELVAKLLNKALDKVVNEPEYNNQTKMLSFLNRLRKEYNA